jgi:N-acylneuraminate cytidylyltransferase
MTCVAIIPARGGSKRIPRKNIRPFAGQPIIGYSIKTALQSQLFDRVIVSTDDPEIAEVAESFGAEVPVLRPAELADDFTGTNDVVKYCLKILKEQKYAVDFACCLYATAPFVTINSLRAGYERLLETGKAFAFSVTSFPFPIQRALKIDSHGHVEPFSPENTYKRSQDLEEAYHDAGQFYWGRSEAFLNNTVMYSDESVPVVLPRHLVQDIDTLEDWRRAELMFAALNEDDL